MPIILGIDPGSRTTGFGVIEVNGRYTRYINSGCIRVATLQTAERLQKIYLGIREIMQLYQPHEVAVEQIFMHLNPGGALKLGQARGVAIVAATIDAIPLAEYSARQVKQSVVGYGAADKRQVQEMIKTLLNLKGLPAPDAADALAVAMCHAHMRTHRLLMQQKETVKL